MAQMKRPATGQPRPTEALFVRIPVEHARRLDRAAFELRRPKQALVSELVERYIDPDSPASLAAFAGSPARQRRLVRPAPEPRSRAQARRRRVTVETLEPDTMVVGHHSFRPLEPERAGAPAREVLSGEQAAELLPEGLRQAMRVFHGVELHHAVGLRDRIGRERAYFGSHQASHQVGGGYARRTIVHRAFSVTTCSRYSALRACAERPSPYASVIAVRPSARAPAAETAITLLRFWKSYTPRGEENRALRAVGSTWLGPAQ